MRSDTSKFRVVNGFRGGPGHDNPDSADTTDRWLCMKEAAAYLSIARQTLLRWVKQGRVPASTLPGTDVLRFRRSALDRVMESRRVAPIRRG